MSFRVNWPNFSAEFIDKALEQLNVALNSGEKPHNIHGKIEATALNMGTTPPELEILEITELFPDRFKGIFKFYYNGNANLSLKTQVQANSLTTKPRNNALQPYRGMVLAQKPLIVPMQMKISSLHLKGIVVLVVDKEKGITLVFKNDPLEQVVVNSTFDDIPNIKQLLQSQIELQLRNLFKQQLPQMIHNLSLLLLKEKLESKPESVAIPEDLNLPHHLKWTGNDFIDDDHSNYYLYRSLSGQDLQSNGLRVIEGESQFKQLKENNTATLSQSVESLSTYISLPPRIPKLTQTDRSSTAYFQLGLQRSPSNHYLTNEEISNYVYRVQNFLQSTDHHSDNYKLYLESQHFSGKANLRINTKREDGTRSSSLTTLAFNDMDENYPTLSSRRNSKSSRTTLPKSSICRSPPASFHKGQVPIVYWSRPEYPQRPILQPPLQPQAKTPFLIKNPVIISPSDNTLTAHLCNLMQSNLTISPNMIVMKGLYVKGMERHGEKLETRSLPDVTKRVKMRKRVHHLKVPKGVIRSRNMDGSLNGTTFN